MDVIKITPEEFRKAAKSIEDRAAIVATAARSFGGKGDTSRYWEKKKEEARKMRALAAKLEHDGREALEFVPVEYEGVQA